MITKLQLTVALLMSGFTATVANAQHDGGSSSRADCPMMKNSAAGVDERGDKAMGFSHGKTAHHFRLVEDGGTIEVSANDGADQTSLSQIRQHLGHIAEMFKQGNFQIPMLVHGEMPAGVSVMQQRRANISYTFEETPTGGRVRIRTTDGEALKAVHQFLRFQIREHRTGDSEALKERM